MSANKNKKVLGYIKLQIAAGQAKPAPPVGPALGQKGLNIMEFCKSFNDKTKSMEPGTPIPVVITAYVDKSFTFTMKKPPNSYYIKKALGLSKGGSTPGRKTEGKITLAQIEEIAKEKMSDMNAHDLGAACQIIAGSARSMGLEVVS